MTTRYLPIPGFPGYSVGDDGTVWTSKNGRWGNSAKPRQLTQAEKKTGHRYVSLMAPGATRGKQQFVHRLVLITFEGSGPEGTECRHKDGNPAHNALTNLHWGTRAENVADAFEHGTMRRGSDSWAATVPADVRAAILREYSPHQCGYKTLATRHGIPFSTVVAIIRSGNA